MNREIIDKAIDVLSELWDGKPKAWADFYNVADYQTVKTALDALRAIPQPDPITGLVPCGCGGSAVLDGAYGDDEVESSYRTEIYCEQCLIRTPIYTEDEQAKTAWNRAMGRKGGAE